MVKNDNIALKIRPDTYNFLGSLRGKSVLCQKMETYDDTIRKLIFDSERFRDYIVKRVYPLPNEEGVSSEIFLLYFSTTTQEQQEIDRQDYEKRVKEFYSDNNVKVA